MEKENKLSVEFTDKQKKFNYEGSIGGLLGNTMTLIQGLYRSIKSEKHREIFKSEITRFVNQGILFMTNEDIEKALLKLNKNGDANE